MYVLINAYKHGTLRISAFRHSTSFTAGFNKTKNNSIQDKWTTKTKNNLIDLTADVKPASSHSANLERKFKPAIKHTKTEVVIRTENNEDVQHGSQKNFNSWMDDSKSYYGFVGEEQRPEIDLATDRAARMSKEHMQVCIRGVVTSPRNKQTN